MAITCTLVDNSNPNRLRYLVTWASGGAATINITCTGAATPDLITDSIGGAIKRLAQVVASGYGAFAAGAQTQAKARALFLSDLAGANPGAPSGVQSSLATAICTFSPRLGVETNWTVDADVIAGDPIITIARVTSPDGGVSASGYLDIAIPGATA